MRLGSRLRFRVVALSLTCLIGLAIGSTGWPAEPIASTGSATDRPPERELHMARLIFDHHAYSNWGPGRPWWAIDWPDAEMHFLGGVTRYTSIDVAPDSRHVRLTDDDLFDYPWLFVQQVGRWHLSADEKQRLREYLDRGGFLVVDDFHGPTQWQIFKSVIDDVLGVRRVQDIDPNDPLMHILYSLDSSIQIPGRRHLRGSPGNVQVRMPASPSHFRGIRDDEGRLMVVINFNTDMGDAWEHADDPMYPLPMTSTAYRFGINYLIYSMTH